VHTVVPSSAPSPRRGRRRPLVAAAVAGLAGALGLGLVAVLVVSSFSLPNPFATTTVEHDDAVALTELRDLARFEAASGGFQTVVDREEDADYLPDVIKGERVTLVVGGDVDAYVDFAGLGEDAVSVSEDGTTVTVTLPEPALDAPRLDHDQRRHQLGDRCNRKHGRRVLAQQHLVGVLIDDEGHARLQVQRVEGRVQARGLAERWLSGHAR